MTHSVLIMQNPAIIPYQELLGNYDIDGQLIAAKHIIPYQELLGNYDEHIIRIHAGTIIPYQELLGNYDCVWGRSAH